MNLSKPLNKYFDHTILKADASTAQVEALCKEALQYDFFSVCVNSCNVALANEMLKDSDVKIAAVVGFPLGMNMTATKEFEASKSLNSSNGIKITLQFPFATRTETYSFLSAKRAAAPKNPPSPILLSITVFDSSL